MMATFLWGTIYGRQNDGNFYGGQFMEDNFIEDNLMMVTFMALNENMEMSEKRGFC